MSFHIHLALYKCREIKILKYKKKIPCLNNNLPLWQLYTEGIAYFFFFNPHSPYRTFLTCKCSKDQFQTFSSKWWYIYLSPYRYVHVCSVVSDSETPWTVARQDPLSMGFPRQEYWSGFSFPSPGNLPNPDIEPETPASPALAGEFFTTEPPGNPLYIDIYLLKLCGC